MKSSKKKCYWTFINLSPLAHVKPIYWQKVLVKESASESHSVLSYSLRNIPMDYTVHRILWPRILERVAVHFSRGSSQDRGWTQVSHIAGWCFTSWANKEAQEYWSRYPIPSPGDLPNPGIEPGSPALQADSLPAVLLEKPTIVILILQTNKMTEQESDQIKLSSDLMLRFNKALYVNQTTQGLAHF